MSIEFKDLKKFEKDGNILLSGEVTINNTNKSDKISIPPVENEDCNIIVSKETSYYFLDLIKKSPLTSTNITLYDQDGNIFNKYVSGRKNNNSGNLSYKTDTKMMLKNIEIPSFGKNYLLLDSYLGADDCHLKEIRDRFINADFPDNFQDKNLTIFTSEKIMDMGLRFPENVKVVLVKSKNYMELANCFVEYIFGKVFGDVSQFNKFLYIGKGKALSSRVDNQDISVICRSEGRIEFSTKKEEVIANFVIFLKNTSDEFNITMDDERVNYINSTCNEKFLALPYVSFYYDFNKENVNDIISSNQEIVISFMVNNPFKSFEDDKTIIDSFLNNIHHELYAIIQNNFVSNHSKVPKYLKFPEQPSMKNMFCQQSGGNYY